MLLYYITDRRSSQRDLIDVIGDALDAGVDLIQIREKDLAPRQLFELALRVKALPNPSGTRILINERLDIALAAGLDGVHLPASHIPVAALRRGANRPIKIGISCHSLQEVKLASESGSDLVVFAPVFAPLSKDTRTAPQGLAALRDACTLSRIPVLALGGLTPERVPDCLAAGAAGVAGITLFQSPADIDERVRGLRNAPLPRP